MAVGKVRKAAHAAAFLAVTCAVSPGAFGQAKATAGKSNASAAAKVSYAERYGSMCAACHGERGRSDMADVPVLAGQTSLYAITQLFLFREGRRDNAPMVAIAKTMTDADLRGFSDFIGSLPPVAAEPGAAPDAARMAQGRVLAQQHKCSICHGADLSGGQQVPRIGGQKESYVLAMLQGYKAGTIQGYTRAMNEAMSEVPAHDVALLAYYVANVPVK